MAAPSRTGEVNRGKTEVQDIQGNAKAKNTKKQKDEVGSPGKTLAGAASAAPTRPLPGRLAHTSGVSHPRAHGFQLNQPRWN